MRIIISNKFYYRRGGDCIYTINLEQLLKEHGHEVAIFAMQHPNNLPTFWKKYFPSEVKFKLNTGVFETFIRPFGSNEVKKKFENLLHEFQPDIIHLNNIHSQLSPILAQIAYKHKIKTLWTIHDCKLVCPRYDCERNGHRCEKCFNNLFNCIKYNCIKNNKLASILGYYEIKKWNSIRLEKYIDTFITPSQYMKNTLIRGHYHSDKIITIPNFIDLNKVSYPDYKKDNYFCYIGRLSKEKGVETLLKAVTELDYSLKIIGGGPLEEYLKCKYENKNNIVFCGQLEWDAIRPLLEHARFTVLPSECAENNPLSVIESLCLGTPVLGANIGGIPELIDNGINGMTFESRNIEDLKNKIEEMMQHSFDYNSIATKAQDKYNAEEYYKKLMTIYNR